MTTFGTPSDLDACPSSPPSVVVPLRPFSPRLSDNDRFRDRCAACACGITLAPTTTTPLLL